MELPASSSAFVKFDYEFIDELGFDFFHVVGTIFSFIPKKKKEKDSTRLVDCRGDLVRTFAPFFTDSLFEFERKKKKKSGAWQFGGKKITQNHNNRSTDDLGTV